jgi:Fur family transcriptional regulator, ferric uptake regulator
MMASVNTTPPPSTAPIPVSDAVSVLAKHGYRLTGPRRQVLTRVLAKDRPFTAEQLVAELPDIARATIYRTLEILASVDLLTRLLQPGGHPAYVAGAPGHRHHLVCSGCGTVVAFTDCPVDQLLRQLSRVTAFSISSHHLEVTGVCPGCQSSSIPSLTAR